MKKTFLLSFLLTAALTASAIPAKKGVKRTLTLSDGTTVEATLQGDEFGSWWQAADGSSFTLNPTTQKFQKADLAGLKLKASSLRAEVNASRVKRLQARQAPKKIGTTTGEYTGTKKGLIILVNFKDVSFNKFRKASWYQAMANGPLRTSQTSIGFTGSVKDYFSAQSNNTFELDFDVVGPYTLPNERAYYGAHSSSGANDVRPGAMIAAALGLADDDVNYADYDWDGDGEVEQVYVMYAGLGEAAGGDADTIWPHEWKLSSSDYKSSVTKDGVKLNTYATGCELTLRNGKTQPDGIGTLCHEFSHCLGLPDMYDTNYQNYGTGDWDVMCSGSYNGDSFTPANYTAYERMFAGWLEPTVLSEATTVKGIKSSTDYGKTFIIYNDEDQDEYYLIENRQQDGSFDIGLPGAGLMITHVDYDQYAWQYNHVNTIVNYSSIYGSRFSYLDNDHERMAIFHADNNSSSSQIYPYNGNNSLTDTSKPAATLYQGTKGLMGKPITNITQNSDGTMSFDFMGGSDTNVITGIQGVEVKTTQKADGRIYSIDGRYLGKDLGSLPGGIYVRDGKKIVK